MNANRLLRWLALAAGALVLVSLAIYLLQRPDHGRHPFAKAVPDAQRITIQTQTHRAELHRSSPTWTVSQSESPGGYRADPGKIKTLLASLDRLDVEDVISERPERAEEFEVHPASGLRVTLHGAKNEVLVSGIIGKQAPDFDHLYFKYADQPEIYLARGAVRGEFGEPTVAWWRDPMLLDLVEDQILTVFIEGPGYKTALARSSNTWSVNGRQVDPTPVWGMLGVLAHLRAADFIDLAKRPDLAPEKLTYATVTIQMRDGKTEVVRIGKLDAANQRYPVAIASEPSSAWVQANILKSVLQKPGDFPAKK